jgi:hypothetical protein
LKSAEIGSIVFNDKFEGSAQVHVACEAFTPHSSLSTGFCRLDRDTKFPVRRQRKLYDWGCVAAASANLYDPRVAAGNGLELGRDLGEEMMHQGLVVQVLASLTARMQSVDLCDRNQLLDNRTDVLGTGLSRTDCLVC